MFEWLGLVSQPQKRLQAALASLTEELEFYIDSRPRNLLKNDWPKHARALLKRAEEAAGKDDRMTGWGCIHSAAQIMLEGATDDELQATATQLRREAIQKLDGWREASILQMLPEGGVPEDSPQASEEGAKTFSRDDVVKAMRIRDESFANVYYRMALVADQLKLLLPLLCLTVALVIYLFFWLTPCDEDLCTVEVLALMASLGMLGGSLSVAINLSRTSTKVRIPEQHMAATVTLLRPFLGAAAALGLYVIVKSGLFALGEGEATTHVLLAAAFAAGFSETFIIRAVQGVTGEKKEKSS